MTGPGSKGALESLAVLLGALREGSIGLVAARAEAAAIGRAGELDPSVVASIAHEVCDGAQDGARHLALAPGELVLEVAQAAHRAHPADLGAVQAFFTAGTTLLLSQHKALFERGDIRVFQRAAAVHQLLTEDVAVRNVPRLCGLAHHRFGALVLDCYTAGRSPGRAWQYEFNAWTDRAAQTNDPDLLMVLSVPYDGTGSAGGLPAARWPEPLAAMDTAETALRAALPLVHPQRRAATFKALLQTLLWRGSFGGPTDHNEMRRIGIQALQELPAEDTARRVAITAMLRQIGVDGGAGDDEVNGSLHELEGDLAALVEARGESSVWDALAQAALLLQDSDPVRALQLFMRRRALTRLWADSQWRSTQIEVEFQLFAQAYRPAWASDLWQGELDTYAARARAEAGTARDSVMARSAAAAVTSVMMAGTSHDRERTGLALAPVLADLDTTLWADHLDALTALHASLLRGEGVNQRNAGDGEAACRYYRAAADEYRELRSLCRSSSCWAISPTWSATGRSRA